MNVTAAQTRIREVQRIMERTTLYTLLPGTAAIVGGIAALVGCAISFLMMRSFDFADMLNMPMQTQYIFCLMWLLVGLFRSRGCGADSRIPAYRATGAIALHRAGVDDVLRNGRVCRRAVFIQAAAAARIRVHSIRRGRSDAHPAVWRSSCGIFLRLFPHRFRHSGARTRPAGY